MIGDEKGYRFEPANITVKQGDGIKFTMVSGGPHNVAFDAAAIPAAGKDQLAANIPNAAAAALQPDAHERRTRPSSSPSRTSRRARTTTTARRTSRWA